MPDTPNIEHFLNIRAAAAPSFSPDGRYLSFLMNLTGVAQQWNVPVEGGWPTQLTFTNESVRSAAYNPRRHEIIFSMDVGGDERTQLFHLRGVAGDTDHGIGDGWVADDVTHQPKAIHTFGGWSRDGDRFAFCANRDAAARFDIYVQERGEAEAKLLLKGPGGYFTPLSWSPDDSTLLIHRADSNTEHELHLCDVKTGKSRVLSAGNVQYHSACWSADGKSIFCASNHDSDLLELVELSVAKNEIRSYREAEEHKQEVENVAASPKGKWLA